MSAPVSLYTVSAVVVLDSEGGRLLAKYYAHDELVASKKAQDSFEATLFQRTRKAHNNEIVMCESRIVVYRANLDVLVYVVGGLEQNELLLACALDTFFDALSEIIKPQLDKRAFLENFDVAALVLDETVDRGIILETEVVQIVAKVAKAPASFSEMPLNEQTISSAFSFARQQIKSLLK